MRAEKIKATQGSSSQAKPHQAAPVAVPDPEVPAKAARRRFTADYKLHLLQRADVCAEPGSLGALLRREGLYSTNLATWRRQRDEGTLSALTPKKRGRKGKGRDPLFLENTNLRKENVRLTMRLRHAALIIDVQKKVSQMLGVPLTPTEEGGTS